jgi:hypothetical protein
MNGSLKFHQPKEFFNAEYELWNVESLIFKILNLQSKI